MNGLNRGKKMKQKEFNNIVKKRISATKELLLNKGSEYATSNDVFHNFKRAAIKRDCSVPEALMGMLVKHQVSLDDIIKIAETSPEKINLKHVDQKLGDYITYLYLLEGILSEMRQLKVFEIFSSHDQKTPEGGD